MTRTRPPSGRGRVNPEAARTPSLDSTYQRIYRAVRRIPRGRVATYGQVARVAGLPGQARLVGYALSALSDGRVPWQRVINARGEISARAEAAFETAQRDLLEAEGVEFDERGRVSLRRFRWKTGAS